MSLLQLCEPGVPKLVSLRALTLQFAQLLGRQDQFFGLRSLRKHRGRGESPTPGPPAGRVLPHVALRRIKQADDSVPQGHNCEDSAQPSVTSLDRSDLSTLSLISPIEGEASQRGPLMGKRLGFTLIPAGFAGFMVALFLWTTSRPPLPIWWIVLDTASLLFVGWGVVLLLPRRATNWGIAYMTAMTGLIPFVSRAVAK